jgi:endonuclease/exonuclease/phosphatase family metal-dependent hydrolase
MRTSRILPFIMLGMLLTGMAYAGKMVRVVTWNVETIGAKDSPAYYAARDVLNRIGADVVAVQEIASQADSTNLLNLARDLGYNYTSIAPGGPFGSDRAAFLSDFPLLVSKTWTAAQLSGDSAANDLTRYILEAEIDVTGTADFMYLVVNHWKSGSANVDEYRRAIESQRVAQVAAHYDDDTPFVLMGDANADVRDGQPTPLSSRRHLPHLSQGVL